MQYRQSFLMKLNAIYAIRNENKSIIFVEFTHNYLFLMRFLDDISNNYNKFKIDLPDNVID